MPFDPRAALGRLSEVDKRLQQLRDMESDTLAAGGAAAEGPSQEELRRVINEQLDEIRDALHPEQAEINRVPPLETESDILAGGTDSGGLAVMIGHTAMSPGYGGAHPPFPDNDYHEYGWNKDLALRIRKFAQSCGVRCEVFTRDGKNVETSYDAVRAWRPTATVELHFNAVENPAEHPDLKGSLVLYGAEASRKWAQTLQDMLVALYDRQGSRENQGIHIPGPNNGYSRGRANVSQIHPSALIEPFFGHNPREARVAIEKKQALAEGIVAAYARLTGTALPPGHSGTSSGPAPGAGSPAGPVSRPVEPPVPPELRAAAQSISTPEFRELWSTYQAAPLALPGVSTAVADRLKLITLAQWVEETGWATSELAKLHRNYAGMKGKSEVDRILAEAPATRVLYQAHDGPDTYLRFAAISNFIKGYWLFVQRSPYSGWQQHAERPADFIRHLARKGWAEGTGYADRIIVVADILRRLGVGNADGTLNPMQALEAPAPPVETTPGSGAPPAAGQPTTVNLGALPPQATADFRALLTETPPPAELKPLAAVLAAQWGIESAWGTSDLARQHYNFAGLPWADHMSGVAVRVPHPTRPDRGDFCRFLTLQKFVEGYALHLDKAPELKDWRQSAGSSDAFMRFLAQMYRPQDPAYLDTLRSRHASLSTPAGGPTAPTPSATPGPAPTGPTGQVVIRLERMRSERRRGMSHDRTVSRYHVLVDGQPVPGFTGMAVERQGPGDNSLEGRYNERRVRAGVYTLYTQHGSATRNGVTKYKTYGYTSDPSVGSVPRPSIRLDGTGRREGILIHPGDDYVWSVGCINLSAPFDDASFRLDWQDSRNRVIALIDLLRQRLGSRFPGSNNQLIKDSVIEIVGEPGPARGADIVTAEADLLSSEADLEFARADLAWAREIVETEAAMTQASAAELFGALAASMTTSASLRMPEGGLVEKAVERGLALPGLRGPRGESLWTPWLTAWRAAQTISEQDVRAPIVAQLDRIAAILVQKDVDVNDTAGQHSPMAWAATLDSAATIDRMRQLGAQIDAYDGSGKTPLHAAAFEGARHAVERLLALGADATRKTRMVPAAAAAESDLTTETCAQDSDAIGCAEQGRDLVDGNPDRLLDFERVISLLWRSRQPRN
jgi:N-acetylmuramoyl-L-alanine amidase